MASTSRRAAHAERPAKCGRTRGWTVCVGGDMGPTLQLSPDHSPTPRPIAQEFGFAGLFGNRHLLPFLAGKPSGLDASKAQERRVGLVPDTKPVTGR